MDLPNFQNNFKDDIVDDLSGFTGGLSSIESTSTSHGPEAEGLVGQVDQDDESETSSGQDGFNEVGEVLVRFKTCGRGSVLCSAKKLVWQLNI